jgi:hypothetical protein
MRKKLKLSSEGGDSGNTKCKRGYCGALLCLANLRLVGVWSQAVGFVFVRFAVKMFSHLTYLAKKFYKICTFKEICKENAAINCIIVQHKNVHSGQI